MRNAATVEVCVNGHEWNEENTYRRPNGNRVCRQCRTQGERQRLGWKARPDRSTLRHDFFDVLNPASAYIAGFIAADGCLHSSPSHQWSLAQSGDEGRDHLAWVADQIGHYSRPTSTSPAGHQTAWRLLTTSAQQRAALEQLYGLTPRKSLTLRWPAAVEGEAVRSFCRGYFDGDGHIGVYAWTKWRLTTYQLKVQFVSGSREFLAGMQPNLPVSTRMARGNLGVWSLTAAGEKAFDLANWLFAEPSLFRSRKAVVFDRYPHAYRQPRWLAHRSVAHSSAEQWTTSRVARELGTSTEVARASLHAWGVQQVDRPSSPSGQKYYLASDIRTAAGRRLTSAHPGGQRKGSLPRARCEVCLEHVTVRLDNRLAVHPRVGSERCGGSRAQVA